MLIIFLLSAFLMSFLTIMVIIENFGLYQKISRLENEIKKKDDETFKKELYLKMIKQDKKMKEMFNEQIEKLYELAN